MDEEKKTKQPTKKEEDVTGLDDDDKQTLVLISKEGEEYELSRTAASRSCMIKGLIENDPELEEVNCKDISSKTLSKIVEWLKYHETIEPKIIEKPLRSNDLFELVDEFDAKFITSLDRETVFFIAYCTNWLDIKDLIALSCACIASNVKGKTPAEIRAYFGQEKEPTEEERAEVMKKYGHLIKV